MVIVPGCMGHYFTTGWMVEERNHLANQSRPNSIHLVNHQLLK